MKLKFFLLLLIFQLPLFAGNLDDLYKSGNDAYAAEDYQKAIQEYQKIIAQGYQSSELYFNLGNCYFRINNIGKTILNYERAYKLNPHDNDIRYNLELARLKVVDRIVLPPKFILFQWWDAVKNRYSISQLSNIMLGFFVLTIALIIFSLIFKLSSFSRFTLKFSYFTGIVFLLVLYIFILRAVEFNELQEAVVLQQTVTVMSAPDENSTDVFILHEGAKIILNNQRENWAKIQLEDGKEGWIKSNTFETI